MVVKSPLKHETQDCTKSQITEYKIFVSLVSWWLRGSLFLFFSIEAPSGAQQIAVRLQRNLYVDVYQGR